MDKFAKARNARGNNNLPKGREAKRNSERLRYKFIVNYVEGLHPDIYKKAEKLYKETKETNPLVMDLTKTIKFMSAVTPDKKIPRYYYQRARQHERMQVAQRQMVLEIPLFNSEQLPTQTVAQHHPLPQQTPAESTQQTTPEHTAPQQTPAESTQQTTPEHTAPQQTSAESPLQLSPHVYNVILQEIQKDPEMWRIFEDITVDNEVTNDQISYQMDDDFMNDEIWNEVCVDPPMPLETIVEHF